MDYIISIVLYLLGALFMILNFEPEEDGPPALYAMFVFAWPLMTVWFIYQDLFGKSDTED